MLVNTTFKGSFYTTIKDIGITKSILLKSAQSLCLSTAKPLQTESKLLTTQFKITR